MTRLPRRVATAAVLSTGAADIDTARPITADASVGERPSEFVRGPNKIVPIRLKEVDRIGVHRFGPSYPDNDRGRLFVRVWLAHAANLTHDATKRMDNFLDLRAPWMSRIQRSAAKEQAFRDLETWSAAELGLILALDMAERTRLRIGSIAPIDCDAEERAKRARERHRDRERDRRRTARERPRLKRPRARAAAVLNVLPKIMEVPVSWICKRLSGTKGFETLKSDEALRAAIHRELGDLERRGLIRREIRIPEQGGRLPVNFVKRIRDNATAGDAAPTAPASAAIPRSTPETPTNPQEYLDYLRRRLAEFTPGTSHQMTGWFSSERPLRKECGMDSGSSKECTDMLFARLKELKASSK